MKVRALFISDCHIGSDYCLTTKKLLKLLSDVEMFEYLYIVGDFIDGWLL
jgi:UDP-2,3-diacylglucosamine pyrophosphatase LpxH